MQADVLSKHYFQTKDILAFSLAATLELGGHTLYNIGTLIDIFSKITQTKAQISHKYLLLSPN